MRHLQRVVIALLAAALLGLVPFAGSSSASGADERNRYSVGAGSTTHERSDARADARKSARGTSKIKLCCITRRTFGLKGWVEGGRTKVHLSQARRYKGHYKRIRTVRTNRRNVYKFVRLSQPCNSKRWYKIYIPPSQRFYAVSKRTWVTRTCS